MKIYIAITTIGAALVDAPQIFKSVDECNKAYDNWFRDLEIEYFYDPVIDTNDPYKTGYEAGIDVNGLKYCYVYGDGALTEEGSFKAFLEEI